VHVLIIDVEYLVALEAEQVLTETLGYTAEIAMPREISHALESLGFDVLFLNASLLSPAVEAAVRRLQRAGKGLVFSSVDRTQRAGLPGFPGIPVISRPFDDEELVERVRAAAGGIAIRSSAAEGA
jgi:DNA-binding NarL/FixJ family response regulator